jgi:hypothetical protein
MSIQSIIEDAKTKVTEMGGGEQFLGLTADLAASCGVSASEILFWVADLGEAMEAEGLKLVVVKGSEKLYAAPAVSV